MHYTVEQMDGDTMLSVLREGKVIDKMNLVLFSTSGVHGTYATIEDFEAGETDDITCMFFFPRTCTIRYGNIRPRESDIPMLKDVRRRSIEAFATIGIDIED